ncbi:hypothetical protein MPSEU_000567300 [Mayamaea pseudoterrestris]|nr:hypothetical protein MPSEU_000567300 [Mayamaea pseudoterrestris]
MESIAVARSTTGCSSNGSQLDYTIVDAEPCSTDSKSSTGRFQGILSMKKKTKQVSAEAMEQSPEYANAPSLSASLVADEAADAASSINHIFRPSTKMTGRRNRQYGANRLPTLDESDSSEVDSSFDEEQIDPNSLSPPRAISNSQSMRESATSPKELVIPAKSKDKLQLFTSSIISPKTALTGAETNGSSSHASDHFRHNHHPSHKLSQPQPATVRDRISLWIARADDHAAHGNDEAAFTQYRIALKLTRSETAKIKLQLKQVNDKHPTTIQSIHSRLHEDWLDVGKCICEIRTKMAIMCERCGDYSTALACGKEGRDVLERHLHFLSKRNKKYPERLQETKEQIKEMSHLLETMKASQASFDDRKAMHEQIVMMRKHIDAEQDLKQRQDLLTTTTLKVQKALTIETRVLGPKHPQIADTLCLLATLALERGLIESSREFIQEAMDIAVSVLGDQHPTTGDTLLQAARIYAAADERRAIDYYNSAIAIFRGAKQLSLVGSTLNEMAVLEIRHKKYMEAMVLLNDALEACAMLEEREFVEIAAQIHRNLGECYSSLKDYEKAAASFSRSVDMQREANKEREITSGASSQQFGDMIDEEGFADTLRRLGKSYMYCGKHIEALNVYGEALALHRCHVIQAAHPGRPSRVLPERQDQLAHTLYCIAEVRETIGDFEEALNLYSESMQLRLFSDAHRAEKRLNMVHCAMCLRGLGNVHMAKGEYEAARAVFEDAMTYCEAHGLPETHAIRSMIRKQLAETSKLAEQHVDEHKSDKDELYTSNPGSQRSCKQLRFPRAEHQRISGDIESLERESAKLVDCEELNQAIESLTKLMAARKALLKLLKAYNRDASDEKYETACTLLTFGKVLLATDDPVNAERALEDSIKLFKKSRTARDVEGLNEAQRALKALNRVQL